MTDIILKHGAYRTLLSFQKSEIIYDGTVYFCNKYLRRGDRTIDQMVQAARSGKQNIAEGSMASGTSKETEIKLTNVARASLEELLLDYQDYARINKISLWGKEHPYSKRLRELQRGENQTYETYKKAIENTNVEITINCMIGLLYVTIYLLKRQLENLEKDFVNYGGIRERMTKARLEKRNGNDV